MGLRRVLFAFAVSGAFALPAFAQEAVKPDLVQTGDTGAPPVAAPAPPLRSAADADNSPEAIGRWAQGVLAGKPAERTDAAAQGPSKARGCAPPPDRKPHGEVWAGVGTGGYREVGGVVTQPIGDCGQVTIAVDKTEFTGGRRRR